MRTDKLILQRKEIIEYIRKNESFYFGAGFDGHTLEQLVVIKTGIELKLANRNDAVADDKYQHPWRDSARTSPPDLKRQEPMRQQKKQEPAAK